MKIDEATLNQLSQRVIACALTVGKTRGKARQRGITELYDGVVGG
jgi:hypothetical protein